MPSLEDLRFQRGVGQQIATDAENNRYRQAAQQASDLFLKGDIEGATGLLMKTDPQLASQLLGNVTQARQTTLNPQLQGQVQQAQVAGQLEAQTQYGVNPAQLRLLDYQSDLLKLQETAKKQQQDKQLKSEEKNDSWSMQAYTRVTSGQPFKDFQEFKTREASMNRALTDPSAYGDIASVFGFMKSLDPRSVVRESEYETAAGAGSLLNRVKNYIGKAEKGQILQPQQRAEIAKLAGHLGSVYKQNYTDALKPLYVQAGKRGIDVSSFDPYAVENLPSGETLAKPQASKQSPQPAKTTYTPGTLIMYQGKQYKVGADGDSLEEVK